MQVGSGREKLPLFDPRRGEGCNFLWFCTLRTVTTFNHSFQLTQKVVRELVHWWWWLSAVLCRFMDFKQFKFLILNEGLYILKMSDSAFLFRFCLTNYDWHSKIYHFSDLERILWPRQAMLRHMPCLWSTVNNWRDHLSSRKYGVSNPFSRSESWDRHILHCRSSTPLTLCFFICHCFLFPHSLTTIAIPIWTQT